MNEESAVQEGTANRISSGQGPYNSSMAVPVFVSNMTDPSNEVMVYALLDTQSDTTFVSEHTVASLGIDGNPATLKLATMTSKGSILQCKKYTSLCVRGYQGKERIQIPLAYSRSDIPLNKEHIPTPEKAKRWEHTKPSAITGLRDRLTHRL